MADEGKVVVTLKGGRDFDAPWIVIHADDPEEAWHLLREIAPVEGADGMNVGQLTVAQAKNFATAYSGSSESRTGGGRANGGRSSGSGNSRSSSRGSSSRSGGGSGKGQPMRSDQWPDHVSPEDFDPCPKHGDLIFKDAFEKNGKDVSARVTCSTPFCNSAPTYWERDDGSFEAN